MPAAVSDVKGARIVARCHQATSTPECGDGLASEHTFALNKSCPNGIQVGELQPVPPATGRIVQTHIRYAVAEDHASQVHWAYDSQQGPALLSIEHTMTRTRRDHVLKYDRCVLVCNIAAM